MPDAETIEQRLRKVAYYDGYVVASEAADLIASLRADVRLWKNEAADRSQGMVDLNLDRAAMGVKNLRLQEALVYYADQFCEYGPSHIGCGKYHEDICSGCKARAALAAGEGDAG